MNARGQEIVDLLRHTGFRLGIATGKPTIGPSAKVTTEVRALLKRNRSAVVKVLRNECWFRSYLDAAPGGLWWRLMRGLP